MNILQDLKDRQIINDITNEKKFLNLPKGSGVYIGFDPTAESLHLGNYIQIMTLLRFKNFGFKSIAVLGGATGMIGDPSGKSNERNLLTDEEIIKNKTKIKKQLESYGLEVVDNYDFYKNINVLEFMRDAGKLININYMLAKDVVASRLDSGISFTEFAYQLIQGWDFKFLYENHNVFVQVGGSDQWGNITTGIEVIRKTQGENNKAVGITTKLLLTKSGKKFGKSSGNAIWINKDKTSFYELYQYIFNTTDDDLETIFNWLTFMSTHEISTIMSLHNEEPKERMGQRKLAFELVKNIHSEEAAKNSEKLSEALFGTGEISNLSIEQKKQLFGGIPSFENIEGTLIEVLIKVKAAQSFREAKAFLAQRSIQVDGISVSEEDYQLKSNHTYLLKRGKKQYYLIVNK